MTRFKFGDIIENGYAGEGNPKKRGVYLWSFNRPGRLNPGPHVKLLHDDGKTGELLISADDKITKVGTIFDAKDAEIALLREAVSDCPCTMIEQDEDCPEGYPSMLCGICKGTGNAPQDQVTALAVEMIKIASDIGEPDDPFAAWESVELLKSQNDQMRKALDKIAAGPREVSKTYAELFAELTAEARAALDAVSATGEA